MPSVQAWDSSIDFPSSTSAAFCFQCSKVSGRASEKALEVPNGHGQPDRSGIQLSKVFEGKRTLLTSTRAGLACVLVCVGECVCVVETHAALLIGIGKGFWESPPVKGASKRQQTSRHLSFTGTVTCLFVCLGRERWRGRAEHLPAAAVYYSTTAVKCLGPEHTGNPQNMQGRATDSRAKAQSRAITDQGREGKRERKR